MARTKQTARKVKIPDPDYKPDDEEGNVQTVQTEEVHKEVGKKEKQSPLILERSQ